MTVNTVSGSDLVHPRCIDSQLGRLGLIRYKLVIHAFVDGKSHLVASIQVHDNNEVATVLRLFLLVHAKHGTPSRMRGDHGTENVDVAQWMIDNCGPS